MTDKETIVVWFSCGVASAVAAKKTIENYGDRYTIRVVNNPIAEEHEDNQRFLHDVEDWIGMPIEYATSSKFPSQSCTEVWRHEKYMSGVAGAPCTRALKKRARQEWESNNRVDWIVLGFTLDEKKRSDTFQLTERQDVISVLIDEGITKADCLSIVQRAGIRPPKMYELGYPNANCIGCVKAESPTYWNHVRETHPEVFKERARQSREIGAKLVRVKGKRIYLDELDPETRGAPMKNLYVECGIFCEEPTDD